MHKIYDPSSYKIVFFSSAPIWVPFLEELVKDDRFEVTGVVTMPDAPAGRGMKIQENVIKIKAKELHIHDINTPNKINPDKSDEGKDFAHWLQTKKPDYIVVIAYGKIIPQAILDIPTLGPINVHGSLLPKYRGASPIQSIFLNNDKETWITIMKMAATLDTGDMVAVQKFTIPFSWTTRDIITQMQKTGPAFLTDTLWKLGKWMYGYEKQDDTKATLCGKIEKESWEINPWKDSIEEIYAKYRAYAMRPKIYFIHKDKRVVVEELTLDESLYNEHIRQSLFTHKKLHPAIQDIILKPEGKKWMSWTDFVNSYLQGM